jgi:short-subunit dehydrogenase
MQQQPHEGHVFLVDGAGVGGNPTKGYASYGATKRAMPQLVASLNKELQDSSQAKQKVCIHNLSPGMVLTDLLLSDSTPEQRKLFNVRIGLFVQTFLLTQRRYSQRSQRQLRGIWCRAYETWRV